MSRIGLGLALACVPCLLGAQERSPAGPPPRSPEQLIESVQVREAFERVVTGAPYRAQTITEITQELPDGNRIERRTTAAVFRDGKGRVRREVTLSAIGALVPPGTTPRVVMLIDAPAGRGYQLDAARRVAQRLPLPPPPRVPEDRPDGQDRVPPPPGLPPRPAGEPPRAAPVSQSLGRKTIEGVEADGTRTTFVVPAGEVGNAKAFEVVHERWYSPELQTVLLSRRQDPRFGTTTYRLTAIVREEPDPALFEVPAGYAIEEAPPRRRPRGDQD